MSSVRLYRAQVMLFVHDARIPIAASRNNGGAINQTILYAPFILTKSQLTRHVYQEIFSGDKNR